MVLSVLKGAVLGIAPVTLAAVAVLAQAASAAAASVTLATFAVPILVAIIAGGPSWVALRRASTDVTGALRRLEDKMDDLGTLAHAAHAKVDLHEAEHHR
jgi:hypothetical protein